ncbi:MAG TPA: hypothetical protein VLX28_10620, partial [Thermoanaerobaculia bacterium]|nr:hypothetical protein [Thermoanaerobaculia bacterium]
ASLIETIAVLLYAVAFALPLLTALLILVTRVGSAVLGETLLFLPPTQIVGLGGPERDLRGLIIAAVLTTFTVYWNSYFIWLLWAVLRELYCLGKARAGAALLISVGGMYAASIWLGKAIEPLINLSLPLWENLFK